MRTGDTFGSAEAGERRRSKGAVKRILAIIFVGFDAQRSSLKERTDVVREEN